MADRIVTVQIRGAKEIEEIFKMLPIKVQGSVMLAALRTGGNLVRSAYKQRIPIRSKPPGAKSFGKKGIKGRLPGFGRASVIVAKKPGTTQNIEVGASKRAFYLSILEFGGKYWAPRGWLRAAWLQTQAPALAKIGGYLMIYIERYAERQARKNP
jgi:hypothetical protein